MPDQREGLRESVAPFVGIRFAGEADIGEVSVAALEEVLGGEVTDGPVVRTNLGHTPKRRCVVEVHQRDPEFRAGLHQTF